MDGPSGLRLQRADRPNLRAGAGAFAPSTMSLPASFPSSSWKSCQANADEHRRKQETTAAPRLVQLLKRRIVGTKYNCTQADRPKMTEMFRRRPVIAAACDFLKVGRNLLGKRAETDAFGRF